MQRIIADPGFRAALVAVSGVNRCGQSHLCPSLPSRAPLIDRKLPTFKQIWTNAGRRKPGGAVRASETGTAAPAESTNERGPPAIAGWAQDALGKILRSLWSAPIVFLACFLYPSMQKASFCTDVSVLCSLL
jgi:hypothetical protein